jgi:GcrA cell cycle regulator
MSEWPDIEVDLLRKLFAEGLSGGQIAAQIPRSRNSIIGKLHRLGLKLSPKASTGRPIGLRLKRKRSGKNYRNAPWKRPIIEQTALTDLLPEPPANPVTLLQLTDATCRWPCSGEGADTLFCGAVPAGDKPYCKFHCMRAYSRPMTRAEKELALRQIRRNSVKRDGSIGGLNDGESIRCGASSRGLTLVQPESERH